MSPARATRFFLTIVARKSEKRIARAGFKFLRATSVEIICKFDVPVEEFHILALRTPLEEKRQQRYCHDTLLPRKGVKWAVKCHGSGGNYPSCIQRAAFICECRK